MKMDKVLLDEIILKREPELMDLIKGDSIKNMDSVLGNQIRSILTDEFLESGMNDSEGFYITARGIAIEQLIDDVGNLFM